MDNPSDLFHPQLSSQIPQDRLYISPFFRPRRTSGAALSCSLKPKDLTPTTPRPANQTPGVAERNLNIWQDAYIARSSNTANPDLVAQEHEAWARYWVSESGMLGFVAELAIVPGYEVTKLLGKAASRNLAEKLRVGPGELSSPSLKAVEAGWKGAFEGLTDYFTSGTVATHEESPHVEPSSQRPEEFRNLDPVPRDRPDPPDFVNKPVP